MTALFAISIPQFFDGDFDPAAFRAYLRRAEELGFESAWTGEQVLGTMPHLSPIETMTFAAACTERIRLGCMMLVSPLYSPVHLAKSLSSLDQLSQGRIEVGIGTGGRFRMFSAFGVEPRSLVARFTEGLRLMRALWTEERVTFDGRFWRLDGAAMEPKPVQRPHPPIWFGAGHPDALRRAVRLGDGFFGAGSVTTAQFADQVRVVRGALTQRDPDAGRFRIAKRVYIGVGDDGEATRRRVARGLEDLYGYFRLTGIEAGAVAGTPDDCVRGLAEVRDAGAELILLNPLYHDAEQMERLAGEVVPRLA
ncbi:MAG TPA: LLM class flavin-dependent oxidoreductase [Candidatus Dormibacteraeota bacterium]|jgi:probable F420-dependent oxidoreductase|nr:LLM class flavin-dependent oxidoreductase [Candidatus Dormibacteraeota bacterium]